MKTFFAYSSNFLRLTMKQYHLKFFCEENMHRKEHLQICSFFYISPNSFNAPQNGQKLPPLDIFAFFWFICWAVNQILLRRKLAWRTCLENLRVFQYFSKQIQASPKKGGENDQKMSFISWSMKYYHLKFSTVENINGAEHLQKFDGFKIFP